MFLDPHAYYNDSACRIRFGAKAGYALTEGQPGTAVSVAARK